MVEQLFRKQQVDSSILSVGSNWIHIEAGLRVWPLFLRFDNNVDNNRLLKPTFSPRTHPNTASLDDHSTAATPGVAYQPLSCKRTLA